MAQIAEFFHTASALIFLVTLFFPLFIIRIVKKEANQISRSLKFWKIILVLAHFFLLVSLVTGVIMGYNAADSSFGWLLSWWFITVIIVFFVLGAFLGISLKGVRQLIDSNGEIAMNPALYAKLKKSSTFLSIMILAILILMFVSPFMH